MKNIKINMKMKNFFEYKRLKNHDTYDYKQFDYKQFTIDETSVSDTNGNVINNNCNSSKNFTTISEKNLITGNSKKNNKIKLNWKLPTTIQTKSTETTNITNIPATIVTSTNKTIITTIKNPLLNLDEQEEKNYIQTYNNTKYNKKKKKSKFILKSIKFPRKYQSVQQLQQQQLENLQQLQQETYLKSKNLKKNSKKIQLDFSNSYSIKNKKKVENFKENHFYNNNNSNSNNNIDEENNIPKTINITTNTTPSTTIIPIQTTTKTIEQLIPITTKSTNKPHKAKILYSIISDTKPFYTTKATSLETLTTLTTKQTKQFNLKREKEKEYFYSKPKSKIYDYMKDFLRKKFNTLTPTSSRKETSKTTTTAGSSLHDDDIYVEFPNCLLKVINNNLGSQKETFQQQQQQQHQYQQQRSYSQHNSPRHHPRYQHLHLPLQNHYQPDTPKKLLKYTSQQQQLQQPQQQQQQHHQSDLPSSSIDNNSKRYDVMQDVRIKLEQLHKKQQLQQQQQQHNQSNNILQQNFQFQQQQQQQQQQQNHLHNHNHNHNQIQNQNQNKNQNLNHNNSPTHHQHHQQQQQQQQQHNQQQNGSPNISNNITPRHRPIHLFPPAANLNTNGNEPPPPHSPSSEEDNSPTEMNNCRRLVDKPPLVKRITMGLFGLNEDSRPLVHTKTTTLSNEQQLQEQQQQQQQQHLGSTTTIDGYVNESICEPEKIISSKFGDSCRQSLTAISTLDTNHFNLDNSEFSFKKKYMRETCSANSSPRIFGPSALLKNKGGLSPTEQIELKGAAWFQAGISREIAVEILSSQTPGQFLVRQSTSKSDCFVLTVRVPPPAPKVAHYLILRTIRGYKIKGFTKEFTSLKALITHHSVMPELLPVPLALPRPTTNTPRRRNVDDFESYGSLRLLGILNMMQTNHNFDRENNS